MAVHPVKGDELRGKVWLDIREVLMEHWDPIGVCDEPFATNEYDGYIPKIKTMLRVNASTETLMDFLDWVATERMGFTSQPEQGRSAAERLRLLASELGD